MKAKNAERPAVGAGRTKASCPWSDDDIIARTELGGYVLGAAVIAIMALPLLMEVVA